MGSNERRLREKEQRKMQILDAARSLVLKKGIGSVSVQQIARLAELSVGTIYLYFNSKEEIFATLQEDILDLLYTKVEGAGSRETTPAGKLRAMALAYGEFSVENKKYFDVINYFLSAAEIVFPPDLKANIDEHGSKILALIVGAINEGVKSGVFSTPDSRRCAITFWGTIHGLIQFRKLKETILRNENFMDLYKFGIECFINSLTVRKGA